MKMLCGLNDVTLIPAKISTISSRSECDPYYETSNMGKHLPLFSAPMSSVIDADNYNVFERNGIKTVIPRNVNLDTRMSLCKYVFCAFGLNEIKDMFIDDTPSGFGKMSGFQHMFVCIDIANGHMKSLYDLCKELRSKYADGITIMTGNIANPDTYAYVCDNYEGCVDYIRIGIGGGSCCTTAANAAVHYPMATLIMKCYGERVERTRFGHKAPFIVADGGFDTFDKIIKAIALGANYVMLGSVLAKSEEACGELVLDKNCDPIVVDGKQMRAYYGMSTKKAQKEFGNSKLKTAEGIERAVPIEYPISKWSDNFVSYIRSAMSYTGHRDIASFVGDVEYDYISANAFKAYYK